MESLKDRIYSRYVDVGKRSGCSCASEFAVNPYFNRLVRKHFPSAHDAAILDLGCGDGALLRTAGQIGYTNARGIDGSPQQVARAQLAGLTNVELGDLRGALSQMDDESEDCVIAFDVLEHFSRDEIGDICVAVHRVLRQGGQFIAHVPN